MERILYINIKMKKWTTIIATAIVIAGVVNANQECRFAPSYKRDSLMQHSEVRQEFSKKIIAKEARFIREIGVDKDTGLTIGTIKLSKITGMP